MIEEFLLNLSSKIKERMNLTAYPPALIDRLRSVVVVSVTTRCNFNCPHCLRNDVDKNKTLVKDLPLPVFEEVLKEAKKVNFKGVSFTGGEPILHPDFSEMVNLTREYGYVFNFVSNGWLYESYWPVIERNSEQLTMIYLSLDGATAEKHDANRNKQGSFEKVVEAIKFYKQKNLPVTVSFCLTKKNYDDIEKMPKFCTNLGVNAIKYLTIHQPDSPLYLSEEQRREAVQKVTELYKKHKEFLGFTITSNFLMISQRPLHFCRILNGDQINIDHDGAMFFCCDIYKEHRNKPLVQELGFKKSLKITLDVINKIKKERAEKAWQNPEFDCDLCDFCNNETEACLEEIMKSYQ